MDLPVDLLIIAVGLLFAGVVTGFLAGLLGIGGGGVLVPVLFETFTALNVPDAVLMHMVLGTSFAVIAPTSVQSFRGHLQKGAVDVDAVKRLVPFVVLGVLVGVLFVSSVAGDVLKAVWVVCGLLLAAKMAFGRDDWRFKDQLPKSWAIEGAVFLIGFLSTLMSIGGGMFFVSLLTLCGFPILRAVATSSGFGPFIAIPGLLGYAWAGLGAEGLPPLSVGYVSVLGALLIIPASVLAAPYGVRAAHGLSKRKLEIAFALFLALVSLRLAVSLLAA